MIETASTTESGESFWIFRQLLDASWLGDLCVAADRVYEQLLVRETGEVTLADAPHSEGRPRIERSSSSVLLDALGSEVPIRVVECRLRNGNVRTKLNAWPGEEVVCDLDQAWLRRQYAPSRYPPRHAPHSWHQDGALAFNFDAHGGAEPPPDALLDMVTCWIPLTPCGVDAPGLELIHRSVERLFHPRELTDHHLRKVFPANAFVAPLMEPGDVLILSSGCLHRTHVIPAMQQDRTSVELRFLPAGRIPERLRGDRFLPLLREAAQQH